MQIRRSLMSLWSTRIFSRSTWGFYGFAASAARATVE